MAALLERLQKTEQFVFTFVGANQDALQTARRYSIPASNALNYAATPAGTAQAFRTLSDATRSYSTRKAVGAKGADLTEGFFTESD
jgi:hypothetical protein